MQQACGALSLSHSTHSTSSLSCFLCVAKISLAKFLCNNSKSSSSGSLSAVSRHKSQIMKEKEATRPASSSHPAGAHKLAAAAKSGAAYQKREKSQKALFAWLRFSVSLSANV
jgi:hypothetical protein